jgi:hypothetical protein
MTKPVLELTLKGTDDVVAVACGECRRVAHQRVLAEQCCLPHICSACGERCKEMGWTMCKPCREKKRAAKDQKLYDDAVKVPYAEYDHEQVCREPYGGEDEYMLADEWDTQEQGRNWAWACRPLPWPRLDVRDILYAALEDNFPEGAVDWLDGEALQKAFDDWLAAQGESTCFMADHTRVVVFPEELIEFDGEDMMPTEGDDVGEVST